MLTKSGLGLALVISLFGTSCSTQYANIKMSNEVDGVMLSTGDIRGQNLGKIKGEHGGAIWDKCDEKAADSIKELVRAAKAKGANAVGDIRWTAKGSTEPACKKGWGYFAMPIFVLTPLFLSTQVTGTAFKTSAGKHGLYMLPQNPAEEAAFIQKLLSQN